MLVQESNLVSCRFVKEYGMQRQSSVMAKRHWRVKLTQKWNRPHFNDCSSIRPCVLSLFGKHV